MKIFWLLVVAVIPAVALAGNTLTIDGSATTQPSTFTVDQLKQQPGAPTTQISYNSHDGSRHHSTCIAVLDLLHATGFSTKVKMDPKADPKTKHPELRMTVTARAADGYAVVFSLAELLPDIGRRAVWIALDEDDQPLEERDTPVRLIVPDDAKPARWIFGVREISVDGPASR
jgi:hypothetical protein